VKAYHDALAPEYDDWYEGLGRFDELGGGRVLHAGHRLVAVQS
jgi:hypothetical protein